MPMRMTHETAASRLLELGYRALEEYPGGDGQWPAEHLECGREVTLTWNRARLRDLPGCPCRKAEIAAKRAAAGERRRAANEQKAVQRMRAAGWEPLEPYPGSHSRWRCRCLECGDESMALLHGVEMTKGCRTCSGRHLITEDSARQILLDAGWRPLTPFPGARAHWPSTCLNCGAPGTPVYETVHALKSGCRMCAARRNGLVRRQRFEPTAVKVMQGMQLEPLEPYPGASKQWLCRCLRCGTLTRPTYGNVSSGGRGCQTCRRIAQGATKKSGYAAAAETRVRAAGYSPLTPYPGTGGPWRCLCRCGRETSVWVTVLGPGSRGCRWCADYGFKLGVPGVTYLLVNEGLGSVKVGVTASGSSRLKVFRRHGWQAVHVETFDSGLEAMSVEREILDWWRKDLNLPVYVSPEDMPIGGSRETAELESMPIAVAVERLKEAASRMRDIPTEGRAVLEVTGSSAHL